MEHGAWSMEHGAWSMEHGAKHTRQNTESTRQNPQDRIQQTEYNDWARSEGNTETKYTHTLMT